MDRSIKDNVRRALEEQRGTDISGEMLAQSLGVSRNAVWKAIKSLRTEGYLIDSATNRGYRLRAESDRLSKEDITANLSAENKALDVRVYEAVDSTNTEAKRLLSGGLTHAALLVAEAQTAGRGRMGRSFYSPKGTGLYMTLAVPLNAQLTDAVQLTTAASAAVVRALEALTDKTLWIKWVNDIFMDGRKICGILTEAIADFETGRAQSVIIGVGVNLTTADFPEELTGAGSLFPNGVTRNRMAAAIADALLSACARLGDHGYIDYYRAHSLVLGEDVVFTENGEEKSARAVDIDETGGLIVRLPDGQTKTLRSGEISLRVL